MQTLFGAVSPHNGGYCLKITDNDKHIGSKAFIVFKMPEDMFFSEVAKKHNCHYFELDTQDGNMFFMYDSGKNDYWRVK